MAEEILVVKVDNSQLIEGLKESQDANQKFTDSAKKNADDLTQSLRKVESELTAIQEAQKKGGLSSKQKADYEFLTVALQKQKEELIKLGATQEKVNEIQNKYTQTTQSLRSQLRAATQALAEMDLQGKKGSAQYIEMAKRAGQLKDAIQDANTSLKNFGSDTRNIDGVIQGIQGVIGAYSIFAGVSSLVGDENKDLQKIMAKMQGLMTVMIGLQQVQNILQKESAFRQTVLLATEKLRAYWTGIQTAATAEGTVAQRAFNVAVKANPIGIFITLLAAAAAALIYYGRQLSNAAKLENERISISAEANKSIADEASSLRNLVNIVNNKKRSDEDRIKALKEIEKQTGGVVKVQDLSVESLKRLNKETETYIDNLLKQARVQAAEQKIIELNKQNFDLMADMQKTQNELLSKNTLQLAASINPWEAIQMGFATITDLFKGETKDVYNRIIEFKNKDAKAQLEQNKNYLNGLAAFVAMNKEIKTGTENIKDHTKAVEEDTRTFLDQLQLMVEQEIERTNRINENRKFFAEQEDKALAEYVDRSEKYLSLDRKRFEAVQANELAEFNLVYRTEKEKTDFQKKQSKERLDFEVAQVQRMIEIYEWLLTQEISVEARTKAKEQLELLNIELQNLKAGLISLNAFKEVSADKSKSLLELMGLDEKQLKEVEAGIQIFESLTNKILGILANRYAKETAYYEGIVSSKQTALDEAQRQLDQEIELAKLGYANNVSLRQKEIEDLKRQRAEALADQEAAQKRQQEIETLQQISGLVTAVANIFTVYSEVPYVGVILAAIEAAAMILSFTTMKDKVKGATSTLAEGGSGIVKGKRHYQGGEKFEDHIEVEDGEAWGVFNRGATKKYGNAIPVLTKALNMGNPQLAMAALSRLTPSQPNVQVLRDIESLTGITGNDYATMEKELINVKNEVAALNDHFKNEEKVIEQTATYTLTKKGNKITKYKHG